MELMEPGAANEVRELLAYPEDTAGRNVMNSGPVTVGQNDIANIAQAVALVAQLAPKATRSGEVYVLDSEGKLAGALSFACLRS